MTEKRFVVECEEYQDTDDMGYAIAPVISFYVVYDNDSKIAFSFKNERTANALCELLNELHEENQRLTDKLNQTALELVDEVISQGKATEISEMSYHEFLDYRAKNGKPMELQL